MFYPYEGYRSVTPVDAARRVNRTMFHNHMYDAFFVIPIGTMRQGVSLCTRAPDGRGAEAPARPPLRTTSDARGTVKKKSHTKCAGVEC